MISNINCQNCDTSITFDTTESKSNVDKYSDFSPLLHHDCQKINNDDIKDKSTPPTMDGFTTLEPSSFDSSTFLKYCTFGMTCSSKTSDTSAFLESMGLSVLDSAGNKSNLSMPIFSDIPSPYPIESTKDNTKIKSLHKIEEDPTLNTTKVVTTREFSNISSKAIHMEEISSNQNINVSRDTKKFKEKMVSRTENPHVSEKVNSFSPTSLNEIEDVSNPLKINNNKKSGRIKLFLPEKFSPITCFTNPANSRTNKPNSSNDCEKNQKQEKWKRWTVAEDNLLRKAFDLETSPTKLPNWKLISKNYFSGTRNHIQCKNRWLKCLQPGLLKGSWSKVEDRIICECVNNGITKWSEVAKRLPGRIAEQAKERWINNLDPSHKRGFWTKDEIKILREAQAKLGNHWSKIAKMIPGRSENSVKNRWYNEQSSRRRMNKRKSKTVNKKVVGPL